MRSTRRVASGRASPLVRESRANYYRGLALRSGSSSSKKDLSHEHLTTPMPADSFKHLEIPQDVKDDAKALRKEIDAWEADEQKILMIDTVQTLATQVGLIQKAAKHLNKDVRDITALDVATYRIHEREEFVKSVSLDKVVLYSHTKALENFREGVKAISSRYPDNALPADLVQSFKEVEESLVKSVEREEILEVQVPEDLYHEVQANLFPSFSNVSPQEYLDFVGGPDGLIDPVAFHVRDLMIQLEKAPSAERPTLLSKLHESIVSFEDAEEAAEMSAEEEANQYRLAIAQNMATKSLTHKIGRRVVVGDLVPERRLERSLENHHPILDEERVLYVHGDVTNVKEATSQMLRDEAPTIEFTARADFNPPTGYRELGPEQLAIEPAIHREIQSAALDFPTWEGEEVGAAINSAELILEMKLFKFFNYIYPMFSDSTEGQKLFMEMYDISPGEPTLEWALSYPCKEHTFHPEHPLWVQVFEDDEDVLPIIWPEYTPVSVEGLAEISSAHMGEHATIRYLPHAKEQIANDAYYNHVFSSLPVEKRFGVSRESILASVEKLSAADKQKAESAWQALSGAQRAAARDTWTFQETPSFTGAQFLKSQESLQKLQNAVSSTKLL